MVQWLRFCNPDAEGLGSILVRELEFTCYSQIFKKQPTTVLVKKGTDRAGWIWPGRTSVWPLTRWISFFTDQRGSPVEKVKVLVTQSCPTLFNPMDCSPLGSFFYPWDFPGKNTRVGCHSLLQGIFLTQKLNLGLPYCKQILYLLGKKIILLIISKTEKVIS